MVQNSWKKFDHLKNIDPKFSASKQKAALIKQILMVGFSGILGIG